MQDRDTFDLWFRAALENCYRSSEKSALAQLADFIGVSLRTIQHWRKQERAPKWGLNLLVYAATGVPAGGPSKAGTAWSGWRFLHLQVTDTTKPGPRGGKGGVKYWDWQLVSPTGQAFGAQELEMFGFHMGRMRDLERELQKLRGPAQYLLALE
ncbi:MAG: hypothetical protein OSA97_01515 [Nevskia sp.]|nr:hypothetical protein [Nevskia sp.]